MSTRCLYRCLYYPIDHSPMDSYGRKFVVGFLPVQPDVNLRNLQSRLYVTTPLATNVSVLVTSNLGDSAIDVVYNFTVQRGRRHLV